MSERIGLARLARDKVRIDNATQGERVTLELLDWLGARSEVLGLTWRSQSGALEVQFRAVNGGGIAFVRALEDQLHALQTPPPAVFSVEIAHELPGRVRLGFTGADGDDLERRAHALESLPGITRVRVSPAAHSMVAIFDPAVVDTARIVSFVRGLDPASMAPAPAVPAGPDWVGAAFNTAVFAACATGALPVPALSAGVLLTAVAPAKRALRALRERRVSVDLLDVTAIGISLATGQPTTAAFITWLLGLGDLLLEHSADRARRAISALMDLDTPEAFRFDSAGGVDKVPAERLRVGDRVLIDAGRRVPADGIVVSGLAMVDEKALTGESEPRERTAGGRVLAATVVVEGQIVVTVERTGTDTTASRIVKILEGAGTKPMTLQRDAERIADRLVIPSFGVAGAAAALTSQIDRATSVLITDFGTGIRVAIPTSALAWMAVAAQQGVLVKGSQYLERLARADVIVFDKTGTLTSGSPEIVDVTPLGDVSVRDIVAWSAGAEHRQQHPIAEAIRRHAQRLGLDVPQPELGSETHRVGFGLGAQVAGHRVVLGNARWLQEHGVDPARGESVVIAHARAQASSLFVGIDGELAGVLSYADTPRAESAEIVRALKAGGRRRVVLLSGDTDGPVRAVATAVGIDEARGDLLPEDKAAYVREAQRQGRVVAMVGDGINDAPALAYADVGISLHGGTDVALETADVVLLRGGLEGLPLAFEIGDATMRAVRRTLGLVIVPNAVAIGLGAMAVITPAAAAVLNNGSTVLAAMVALAPLWTHRVVRPDVVRAQSVNDEVRTAVHRAAGAAAVIAAALSPVPLADEIALLPVFGGLAARVARARGLPVRSVPWRAVAVTTASGLAARATLNLAVAFIPGVAAVANAASAVALMEYFGHWVDGACEQPANAKGVGVKTMFDSLRASVRWPGGRDAVA